MLALLVTISVRASGDAGSPPAFDQHSNRFALAVVPDTQYLFDDDRGDSEPVSAAFEWIVNHRAAENIAFVAGVGDVTQDGLQDEVDRASAAYRVPASTTATVISSAADTALTGRHARAAHAARATATTSRPATIADADKRSPSQGAMRREGWGRLPCLTCTSARPPSCATDPWV